MNHKTQFQKESYIGTVAGEESCHGEGGRLSDCRGGISYDDTPACAGCMGEEEV